MQQTYSIGWPITVGDMPYFLRAVLTGTGTTAGTRRGPARMWSRMAIMGASLVTRLASKRDAALAGATLAAYGAHCRRGWQGSGGLFPAISPLVRAIIGRNAPSGNRPDRMRPGRESACSAKFAGSGNDFVAREGVRAPATSTGLGPHGPSLCGAWPQSNHKKSRRHAWSVAGGMAAACRQGVGRIRPSSSTAAFAAAAGAAAGLAQALLAAF